MQIGFWVLAAVVLITGLLVVIVRSLRTALISFGICLSGVACLMFFLDSLVIALALVVLALCVTALLLRLDTNRHAPAEHKSDGLHQDKPLVPFVAAIALGLATALLLRKTYIDIWKHRLATEPIDSERIAFWQGLLTDNLPMLLVGVMLLVLVTIVYIGLPNRDSAS